VVRWNGAQRRFAAGERIHTENSYKYTVEVSALCSKRPASQAPKHWSDEQNWFSVFWAPAA
jgi:uncharacterized SAM-dependent methyltransferase